MSVYNQDELVPPSWINQTFLEKVLQQYANDGKIKLTHFDISPASMKGDHYASIMFRCKVSYSSDSCASVKQKSLILKTLPAEEGPKRDLLKESKLFETEIEMYTKALPKIEQLLTECGAQTKLAADIIYHSLEPHKVIIFQDLCEAGYETIRGRYLNEDELKIVYRKLAKLHAASFVLGRSEDSECVTKFDKGIFTSTTIIKMPLVIGGIANFIDMLAKDEQLKIYLKNVEAMQPVLFEKCKNLYDAYKLHNDPRDIFVLNHGDFHMKNMMFKFESENQAEDMIMVDYQISCFAPSTVDLTYSQYLVMSPELRLRRNEFMHYYFEEFIGMLKKLNFEGELPKYSDFQIAAIKYRHFAIFLLSTFLPHVAMFLIPSSEELKDVDSAKYIESDDLCVMAYQQQQFIDEMRSLLPKLLMDGYLD